MSRPGRSLTRVLLVRTELELRVGAFAKFTFYLFSEYRIQTPSSMFVPHQSTYISLIPGNGLVTGPQVPLVSIVPEIKEKAKRYVAILHCFHFQFSVFSIATGRGCHFASIEPPKHAPIWNWPVSNPSHSAPEITVANDLLFLSSCLLCHVTTLADGEILLLGSRV